MQVFILDGTTPVGVLGDSYEKLEWVRRLWQPNKVTLDLNLRQLHATQIQKGRILWLAEDNVAFLIEHIETNDEPGAAKDAMRVRPDPVRQRAGRIAADTTGSTLQDGLYYTLRVLGCGHRHG